MTFSRVSCIWLRRNFSCRRRMAAIERPRALPSSSTPAVSIVSLPRRRSSSVFGRVVGALPVRGERRGHGPAHRAGAARSSVSFSRRPRTAGAAAPPGAGRACDGDAASGRRTAGAADWTRGAAVSAAAGTAGAGAAAASAARTASSAARTFASSASAAWRTISSAARRFSSSTRRTASSASRTCAMASARRRASISSGDRWFRTTGRGRSC
jgi:hypothetical protein